MFSKCRKYLEWQTNIKTPFTGAIRIISKRNDITIQVNLGSITKRFSDYRREARYGGSCTAARQHDLLSKSNCWRNFPSKVCGLRRKNL
jgi:hypothetical protein